MRYFALATDYDGTLAHHGLINEATLAALEQLRASGRKLVLVTGRELPDLQSVCGRLDLFDRVVAENGALIHTPDTRDVSVLGEPPDSHFLERLRERGVPFSVGNSIVATTEPHEKTVLEAIRDLGLELQVVFNKGAVMVLPAGINKATGLRAALRELALSPHNAIAIGDAENDHALLSECEVGVAVANAVDSLKSRADWVTEGARGEGVIELVGHILDDDLAHHHSERQRVLLGRYEQGEMWLDGFGGCILVAGPSGSGKSTAITGVVERIGEAGYQFAIIDPEGDYEAFPCSINQGNASQPPSIDAVLQVLAQFENPVVSLLGVKFDDRPAFLARFLPRLQELRNSTGRPHCVVFDEAHHVFPADWQPLDGTAVQLFGQTILITVHPEHVAKPVLEAVNIVIAVGRSPEKTLREFTNASSQSIPTIPATTLRPGEVLVWRKSVGDVNRVHVEPGKLQRLRHRRKYSEGDIHEKAFYFRGPENRLNLRAQNLMMFMQIAEGVDDETWLHHLNHKHYSDWIRTAIKDGELAREVEDIESATVDALESRKRIFAAIHERYTGAA
jgi:hydroxymethylpyrimidine pyrophosphatase-like HAD family hydrolase